MAKTFPKNSIGDFMRAKLTNTEIIDILRADRTFLKKEFGVINIGLFGSYAKGNQKADSDIDLLVELKEPKFEWLAGLQIYLEMKFGRKIELVRKGKNVNRRLTKRIERDVIYA
jgi:predicted nucleotidyltransferase